MPKNGSKCFPMIKSTIGNYVMSYKHEKFEVEKPQKTSPWPGNAGIAPKWVVVIAPALFAFPTISTSLSGRSRI